MSLEMVELIPGVFLNTDVIEFIEDLGTVESRKESTCVYSRFHSTGRFPNPKGDYGVIVRLVGRDKTYFFLDEEANIIRSWLDQWRGKR